MLRTFNCGIGLVLVIPPEFKTEVLSLLKNDGGIEIGKVVRYYKSGTLQLLY